MKLVVAAVIALSCARAHAQVAVIPPVELSLGQRMPTGDHDHLDVLAGLHWASLAWMPSRFDLGFGYLHSRRDADRTARAMPQASDTTQRLDGVYAAAGYAVYDHAGVRAWLTARLEVLWLDLGGHALATTGSALRFEAEFYERRGFAHAGCGYGVVAGALAVGGYVELSHRDLPDDIGRDAITGGLIMRFPFVAMVGGGR